MKETPHIPVSHTKIDDAFCPCAQPDWKDIATGLYDYFVLQEGTSKCVREYEEALRKSLSATVNPF